MSQDRLLAVAVTEPGTDAPPRSRRGGPERPHPSVIAEPPAPAPIDPPEGWYPSWGQRLGSALLLLVTLPPALAVALPIALINWFLFGDARRILYRQPRVGWMGRKFHIYKFRTMREAPGTDFQSWQRGDKLRITGFGKFLRRTHLDELPQLINVARGEMTFVGPRPEMMEVEQWAEENVPGFSNRLVVRPGITGHAQVTQGHTYMDRQAYTEKLRANEFYIRNLSVFFDLAILARTCLCVLPLPLGLRRQPPEKIAALDGETESTSKAAEGLS